MYRPRPLPLLILILPLAIGTTSATVLLDLLAANVSSHSMHGITNVIFPQGHVRCPKSVPTAIAVDPYKSHLSVLVVGGGNSSTVQPGASDASQETFVKLLVECSLLCRMVTHIIMSPHCGLHS